MIKNTSRLITVFLVIGLILTGCGRRETGSIENNPDTAAGSLCETVPLETESEGTEEEELLLPADESAPAQTEESESLPAETLASQGKTAISHNVPVFDLSSIPPYSGEPYIIVNDNNPYFNEPDLTDASFERYAPLDPLGRCGAAEASVGPDLMPQEEREGIGMIKPTGWHTVKYDCVDGKYLYNRCHLIGYQLTGENANTRNLITGTRYLNIEGMLPFENMTADYVKETGNHVMYRVTPIYKGEDLLAAGVLMEGLSVEDGGEGICYCIFAYNVQPGVEINYANGDSCLQAQAETEDTSPEETQTAPAQPVLADYILNLNTRKFHRPNCSSVGRMKEKNKKPFTGAREELLSQGYEPCKNCNP